MYKKTGDFQKNANKKKQGSLGLWGPSLGALPVPKAQANIWQHTHPPNQTSSRMGNLQINFVHWRICQISLNLIWGCYSCKFPAPN